jgi:hypothetical protein
MKNDPAFKFVAVVIIAGIILAFANTGSTASVNVTSTAKVVTAAHS